MVCSFLLFPVPLCHFSAVIPLFWIFVEVTADNSFPDFRSPFPVPRSPFPVPRFRNIPESRVNGSLRNEECRHESEIYNYQRIQLSNNKFINVILGGTIDLGWL